MDWLVADGIEITFMFRILAEKGDCDGHAIVFKCLDVSSHASLVYMIACWGRQLNCDKLTIGVHDSIVQPDGMIP